MKSTRVRAQLAAAIAVIAAMTCTACGAARSSPAATPSTTSTSTAPGGRSTLVIPASAVPWAALPLKPYLPTPLPVATATPEPLCRLQDLTEQPPTTGGAGGNEAVIFEFTNHSPRPCLTGGYPHVALNQPGQATVVPTTGGFWDTHTPPSDLSPGATARFAVGFSLGCETGNPPPWYEHISVTLPGGGTFTQTLSGTIPPDSQIPLGIVAECGVTVSELAAPAPPDVYPSDPLAALTSSIRAPSTVDPGAKITYIITMFNPTSAAVALDPCRGYYQTLDSTKGPSFSYELNCAAAQPIAAKGSESFVMEIGAPTLDPGTHSLCWTLDQGAGSRPPTCVDVNVAA